MKTLGADGDSLVLTRHGKPWALSWANVLASTAFSNLARHLTDCFTFSPGANFLFALPLKGHNTSLLLGLSHAFIAAAF